MFVPLRKTQDSHVVHLSCSACFFHRFTSHCLIPYHHRFARSDLVNNDSAILVLQVAQTPSSGLLRPMCTSVTLR